MKRSWAFVAVFVLSTIVHMFALVQPVSASAIDGKTCAPYGSNEFLQKCPFGLGETDLTSRGLALIPLGSKCFNSNDNTAATYACDYNTDPGGAQEKVWNPTNWSTKVIAEYKAAHGGTAPTNAQILAAINNISVTYLQVTNEPQTTDWSKIDCSRLTDVNKTKCEGIQTCIKNVSGGNVTTCVNSWDNCMASKTDQATADACKTKITTPVQVQNPGADQETCAVDGIGWLICPVARFLSKVTDGAYAAVEHLLVFRVAENPLATDASNPVYGIWSSVRNLANIAFVIAFFIVIFSQATSIGISAYGIRKMLPRIIVAAILVNLSYYICIFGIDVSNIIGAGLDGIIKTATTGLPAIENGKWENVMSTFMAGGLVAAGVAGVALFATGFGLAFLVTALLAILTALIVLLGRYAMIIMLIILSPLAFVAYILPNTEGLFNKWRKAFIAMLVMYPLIAILFAGSKVASSIMMNMDSVAPTGWGWMFKLFALVLLSLPLFGVPWIVKFSGGVLGKVAGIVNNRNKGAIDRARNYGNEIAKANKAGLAQKTRENALGKRLNTWGKNEDGTDKKGFRAKTGRFLGKYGGKASGVVATGANRSYDAKAARESRVQQAARLAEEGRQARLAGEVDEKDFIDPQTGQVNEAAFTAAKIKAQKRSKKLALQAAGVAGEEGAERIRQAANEKMLKEWNDEVERRNRTLGLQDLWLHDTEVDVVDDQGRIVEGLDKLKMHERMAALQKGYTISWKDGKGDVHSVSGKDAFWKEAAMLQMEKTGDNKALSAVATADTGTEGSRTPAQERAALLKLDKDGNPEDAASYRLMLKYAQGSTAFRQSFPHLIKSEDGAFGKPSAESLKSYFVDEARINYEYALQAQTTGIDGRPPTSEPMRILREEFAKAMTSETWDRMPVDTRMKFEELLNMDAAQIRKDAGLAVPSQLLEGRPSAGTTRPSTTPQATVTVEPQGSVLSGASAGDVGGMTNFQIQSVMSNAPIRNIKTVELEAIRDGTSVNSAIPVDDERREIHERVIEELQKRSSQSQAETSYDVNIRATQQREARESADTAYQTYIDGGNVTGVAPNTPASGDRNRAGNVNTPQGSSTDYRGRPTPLKADGTPMTNDEADAYHDRFGGGS